MSTLQKISLFQFKNYLSQQFSFTGQIIGIFGKNGIGKTNLLDAIHYLCFTKSYFSNSDISLVYRGAQGFRVVGTFNATNTEDKKQETMEVVGILRETGKKEFSVNGTYYEKLAHHIGKIPCVFIAPDDAQLITGGSEARRRYIDLLLCQTNSRYLQSLMQYNRVLLQRNSLLKGMAERKTADLQLLDVYDEQLIAQGSYIFEQRTSLLQQLLPAILILYRQIAETDEAIELVYESALLHQPFARLLQQAREKDMLLQRSTQGIHRDDLLITLGETGFKSTASQGQRKSLLFAMKLAEFDLLRQNKGFPPILLLDDVFEKLDEHRMQNLLKRVCLHNNGQVFFTDTHSGRLEASLNALQIPFQLIELA